MEFKKSFPKINFGGFYVADGNIIIQDCTPETDISENERIDYLIKTWLNSEESLVTFQLVDALKATEKLLKLLARKRKENTLVLFPGNGALSVKKYLSTLGSEFANGVYIPVSRTMIDKGKFKVLVDLPDLPKNFSKILLIDDVVASGQTAATVVSTLSRRIGILPPIDLACWLILDSRDPYYPAGLPYFRSVFTSLVIRGNNVSKPPINSLSCLIDQTGRYDIVKRKYVEKYFKDTQVSNKLLNLIGGLK